MSTCVHLVTKHEGIQDMFRVRLLTITVTQTDRNMDVINRAPLLANQDQGLMLPDER